MSTRVKAAIFTTNNCRVVKGVDPNHFSGWKNVVVNPDLSKVRGLPPHHWKLGKNGSILPMSKNERLQRDQHIEKHGADNRVILIPKKAIHGVSWKTTLLWALLWMSLGASLLELWIHFQ